MGRNNKMSILRPEYKQAFESNFAILQTSLLNCVEGYPEMIYYYTSDFNGTVNAIIHRRELWFANIAFLNRNLDYIKSLAYMPTLNPVVKKYLETYQPITPTLGTQIYVTSFSSKPSFLPILSALAKSHGYCIGFDTHEFTETILDRSVLNIEVTPNRSVSFDTIKDLTQKYNPESDFQGVFGGGLYLCPVIYDKNVQIELLNTIVKTTLSQFEDISKAPDLGLT